MARNTKLENQKRKEKRRIQSAQKRIQIEKIEGEEWVDIKGYEGLYQVSSIGRVKSVEKTVVCRTEFSSLIPEKLLSPAILKGYKAVSLSKNGKSKGIKVHRLVAINFIPNPENKPFVNHIDFNKLNCDRSNLEWTTARENTHHYQSSKSKTGFVGVYFAKEINRFVAAMRANGVRNYIGVFLTKEEAIKAYEAKKIEFGLF